MSLTERFLLAFRVLLGHYKIDGDAVERMYGAGNGVLENADPRAIAHVLGSIGLFLGVEMTFADDLRQKAARQQAAIKESENRKTEVVDHREQRVAELRGQIRTTQGVANAALALEDQIIHDTMLDLDATRTVASLVGVELEDTEAA